MKLKVILNCVYNWDLTFFHESILDTKKTETIAFAVNLNIL